MSYLIGAWIGGTIPIIIVGCLLGIVFRIFVKVRPVLALAICAIPAAAVSTVIYAYSSSTYGEPLWFEGAITYFVPGVIVAIVSLIVATQGSIKPKDPDNESSR